jgi:uncharacterized membrane protein
MEHQFRSNQTRRFLTALQVHTWGVPFILAAVALFFRTYRAELLGWLPDSYERLESAQRLLAADIPLSPIYPPGVDVIMAPFFSFLPPTLDTMQAVIVASGVLLTVVCYAAVLRLTHDRLAAALLALFVAVDSAFVYAARDPLFDTIVTLLFATALLLIAPALGRRQLWAFFGFGLLLALLVNIRLTNVALLPALLVYWHYRHEANFEPRAVLHTLLSAPVIVAGSVLIALTVVSAAAGGWFAASASAPLTLETYLRNVFTYQLWQLYDWPGILLIAPLAAAGSVRLWRLDRALALAVAIVLIAWPLAHSPFGFANERYMLPGRLLVWFLVALGPAQLWAWRPKTPALPAATPRTYALASTALLALFLVASSVDLLGRWPAIAASSDEGLLREFRPHVAELDPSTLVISAASRGLRQANDSLEYLDLIDHTMEHGNDRAGLRLLGGVILEALGEERPVYYLYTRFEQGSDMVGDGSEGYGRYLEEIQLNFELTEVLVSSALNFKRFPWVLYKVEREDTTPTLD